MSVGTQLSITKNELIPARVDEIELLIDQDTTISLKNRDVIARYDISLYDAEDKLVTQFDGIYEVRILLPENLREYENIVVVYLDGENIEVFNTSRNGHWISFDTTHFSEFYLTVKAVETEASVPLLWIMILLLVIIAFEVTAILIKRRNNELRLRSSVLPLFFLGMTTQSMKTVIWILVVIIILLLIYLIYLFIITPPLQDRKTIINYQVENTHMNLNSHQEIHYHGQKEAAEEEVIVEEPKEAIQEEDEVEIDDTGLKIRYNYSFVARMHQAPLESQERFSELKNYILSYKDVTVKKSWKYERFMYKGKPILKAWIHGNNLKLYYNLDPKTLKDSKYTIEDVSYAKMHESTPTLFIVSGPRLLDYSKELVDMYLKDIAEKGEIPTVNYTLKYISRSKLVDMKLIRVKKY